MTGKQAGSLSKLHSDRQDTFPNSPVAPPLPLRVFVGQSSTSPTREGEGLPIFKTFFIDIFGRGGAHQALNLTFVRFFIHFKAIHNHQNYHYNN